MDRHEANRQLCKMQGEVADRLELKTICTCGDTAEWVGEVPDEVISELWTLIADGYLFRHLREIISKERPKGRRLNLEELSPNKTIIGEDEVAIGVANVESLSKLELYKDGPISMGCGSPKPCSICEGKEPDFVPGKEPGEVVMKARRLIDAMDDPDPVTAMLDIATERAKERENEDRDRAGEQADHKEPLSESLPGGRGQVGGQGRDGEDQGEVSYVAPEDADEGAITQLGREVSDPDGAGDRRFGSAVIDGEINPIPVAGVGGLMLKAVGPPKKSPGYPPRTDLPEIAVPPFEGGRTGGEYIEPELAKPAESVRPVTRKLIQKMVLEGTFDLLGSEFYEGQLVELQPVEGGPKFIVTAKELARLQQEIHNKFVEGLRKAPGIEVEECKVSYSPSIPVCEKCGRHMDYLGNHDFICWKCSRTE